MIILVAKRKKSTNIEYYPHHMRTMQFSDQLTPVSPITLNFEMLNIQIEKNSIKILLQLAGLTVQTHLDIRCSYVYTSGFNSQQRLDYRGEFSTHYLKHLDEKKWE